jgi:hypothetical protein
MRGKGSKLGEGEKELSKVRGKGSKLGEGGKELGYLRGKGSKLGESCPKVRLSQVRISIKPFPSRIS